MTATPTPIRGIAGLQGREPIACALTVGKKGNNGAPTEKDRFHILEAAVGQKEYAKRDGGTYKAPARDPHPSFTSFNTAEPAKRRTIPVRLAHLTVAECFEFRLQCGKTEAWTNQKGQQVRPIPAHPKKGPSCMGNGEIAQRWNGTEYVQIKCPGELCEYSVKGPVDNYTRQPKKAPCGPWMRFVGRFDWPPVQARNPDGSPKVNADGSPAMVRWPNLPFKFTSSGWNSLREFVGFFDAFKRTCAGFGVDPNDVPLFGMPVTLTLAERYNMDASPPSKFPVVSIGMAGEADLIGWIDHQLKTREQIKKLAAATPIPALTDASQQAPDVIDADYEAVSAPTLSVPARS